MLVKKKKHGKSKRCLSNFDPFRNPGMEDLPACDWHFNETSFLPRKLRGMVVVLVAVLLVIVAVVQMLWRSWSHNGKETMMLGCFAWKKTVLHERKSMNNFRWNWDIERISCLSFYKRTRTIGGDCETWCLSGNTPVYFQDYKQGSKTGTTFWNSPGPSWSRRLLVDQYIRVAPFAWRCCWSKELRGAIDPNRFLMEQEIQSIWLGIRGTHMESYSYCSY